MTTENIHDALNYIDDDMIEAVDRLRASKQKRKKHFSKWGTLAACFIVLIAASLIGTWYINNQPNLQNPEFETGISGGNDREANDQSVDFGTAGAMGQPSVFVKIEEWNDAGFSGTVVGTEPKDIGFENGQKVTVIFEEEVSFGVKAGGNVYKSRSSPSGEEYDVGKVLNVLLSSKEDSKIYTSIIYPAEDGEY